MEPAPDAIARLLANPGGLPAAAVLPALREALRARGVAVVQAPPGTGKTTLVPPAVAYEVGGRVVVTQPRRVAARAAARRLAWLLGEEAGQTVGYSVRGDSRTSRATRVEVVTTGVMLRRLQRDPELAGVSAVVLDEVHERHLDSDLVLAMLVDVRAALRPDLAVVAMSATVEAGRTAALLGDDAAPAVVVSAEAALHPVDVEWRPLPARARRMDERGVTPAFLDHVAATVVQAAAEREGDVLVFVPGVREIDQVVRRLTSAGLDAAVLPLHGRLPADRQDAALMPGGRRRVVVSTAVAESSLTVPGVRVVVDAGLSREPRTDLRRGLAGLVTVSVNRSSAEQRAGRAGREAPGAVYRCWSPEDHARLPEHPTPEILTADLTSFLLETACWGSELTSLALLDPPPEAAAAVARETLTMLGALDDAGRVTERGRRVASVPTDPRLARALLDASDVVGPRRAAEVVALLDQDVRRGDADLVAALRDVRRGGPGAHEWRASVRRLEEHGRAARGRGEGSGSERLTDDLATGLVVALAHPERVARRRRAGGTYLMVGGTGAALPDGAGLAAYEWLAVADADRAPGRRDAYVRGAAPLDEDLALAAAGAALAEDASVAWTDGRVVARRTTSLGAIELTSEAWKPSPEQVAGVVRDAIARDGLDVLPWSVAARSLRARLAVLHGALGEPWPDMSDAALLDSLDAWLGPSLARVRTAGDLQRVDVLGGLRTLLPWPQAGRLDELVPERIELPSGSTASVDYAVVDVASGDAASQQPVLAVKVQEVFGWSETPRLADGRVPLLLHLLSPARRPVAITADLRSFWDGPYRGVRADMRGRYPKHDWPEDPWTAVPSTGVRRTRPSGR
ncbi:ATP-dependent helicase HrpB [Flavimobilis soli]|uniref:RNA helicase n=1 Tax=Flavimobilis soli TaxID=442709 RepID=A0A2A9E9E5_9MICO|nr:ATP-dependent helicase HrpB [Flavimobilis soli]PFG35687.1 ATP-dependent helicase HrpB [Flavimobilis soli]